MTIAITIATTTEPSYPGRIDAAWRHDRCPRTGPADASLEGMVKINTFHALDGKNTSLAIDEQALVIAETKATYAGEPHPAWTAVGTTGLFRPRGIVEIEMVVYAPLGAKEDR